jgi:hypothetical protein
MNSDNAHRVTGLLKALMLGIRCKVGDTTWVMGETTEGAADLCSIAVQEGSGKEVYLRAHASLAGFVSIAEKMTEEEWTVIAGNLSLNQVHHRMG